MGVIVDESRELKIQNDLQTAKNSLFDPIEKPITYYKNEDEKIIFDKI
jgi:hypothetical protein